jgi:hypothetical protein
MLYKCKQKIQKYSEIYKLPRSKKQSGECVARFYSVNANKKFKNIPKFINFPALGNNRADVQLVFIP